MENKKYKIEHDRENCIACGACAVIAPEFWVLNKEDGKADIVNGSKDDDGYERLDIDEKDFPTNKDAADACPVNVIHILDKETKKRII
jgi:ferredoxin